LSRIEKEIRVSDFNMETIDNDDPLPFNNLPVTVDIKNPTSTVAHLIEDRKSSDDTD